MKRLRLRAVLIVILVIVALTAAHQLWDYIEVRRLAAEIEKVVAKGEPVTEGQAMPGWSSHERDAGAYYIAAGMVTRRPNPDPMTPVREWLAGAAPAPDGDALRALKAYVEGSREALGLADEGAALSFTRLPPGTEYSFRTAHIVGVGQLMAARTLSLSLAGQGDAAVAAALSSLELRRPIREIRWPFLYNGAGHETAAILSLSQPSTASLTMLQRALERQDARDDVLEGLLADRAQGIERVWRQYYGPDPVAYRDYRPRMRGLVQTVRRPLTTHGVVRAMRRWAELIDAVRKPWPERLRAVEALDARHGPVKQFGPEQMLLFPSVGEGGAAGLIRPQAMIIDRASSVAIAIERFRRDNAGALPASLAELAPEYLNIVPLDPYSGRHLLFAKDDRGYTVYSAGADGADNGGDLISQYQAAQARGYGRRPLGGRDVGVRVWTNLSAASAPPVSR